MFEPKPARVQLPRGGEPLLKVGIILEEDGKKVMNIRARSAGYTLSGKDVSFELDPRASYKLSAQDGYLLLSRKAVVCLECAAPLAITAGKQPLTERSGLEVESVVAGRGFHWRKELTQTLPGDFEIHLSSSGVVLVNVLTFEDYVSCVIASEMAPACPPDFIRAQAVAARSWALTFLGHKHSGKPYTICNDDDCQRYQGTTHIKQAALDAIAPCRGEFLLAEDGFVCAAYYAKSCGGHTEEPANIFSFEVPGISARPDSLTDQAKKAAAETEKPALNLSLEKDFTVWLNDPAVSQSAFCSPAQVPEADLKKYIGAVDEAAEYFRWRYTITQKDLTEILQQRAGLEHLAEVTALEAGPRGRSGRLTGITVHYKTKSGAAKKHFLPDNYEIRRCLHHSFLFSSAFVHDYERDKDGRIRAVNFHGAGWGHGVGLCQIGAVGMALKGFGYKNILQHYYPGAKVKKAY